MEGRFFSVLLRAVATGIVGSLVFATTAAFAVEPAMEANEQIIQPEIDRREIKEAKIDTEDFEIGSYAGVMNVEDFGTNFVWGVRAAYHVTEDVFVEAAWGRTDTDQTSFEKLSGGAQLLADDERQLTYYNVSAALNLLPGEYFIAGRWALNTTFYIIGGIGSTSFANDDQMTWNAGAGVRILANDWASLRIDARDHSFQTDILGSEDRLHNLEFTGTLSVFF